MRVLVIGEKAPGALADSYARGFEALGARVERYCDRAALVEAFPPARWRAARRLLMPLARTRLNRRVREELAGVRADLVLVVKGEQFEPDTVRALRRGTGAPVVSFYPDDPFSRDRANRLVHGAPVLAAYDACFTFARHLIPQYRAAGANRVLYLPFAWDPALHGPVSDAGEPEFDVVFVGNLDAERVRWLEALAGLRLAVIGNHTRRAVPRGSPLGAATFLPAAVGADFARSLHRGAVALNLMREQNRLSHNMRSFEAPACGAFVMSQRTPELGRLFREDEEIVCFGTPAELRSQVEHWLERPEERRRVAAAGLRRVREETYEARARGILERLGIGSGVAT